MQHGLALMTEAAGEAAGRMVAGEAAGLAEEDREDIKLLPHLFLLKTHKIYS
jgi:hypothetical protein